MFTAQLWGKKDIVSLHKVLGLCLAMGIAVASFFLISCELFPTRIIGIFTVDPQVIALGSGIFADLCGSFSILLNNIRVCFGFTKCWRSKASHVGHCFCAGAKYRPGITFLSLVLWVFLRWASVGPPFRL